MKEKLLSYFKFGNSFCGVELSTVNGKEVIYTTRLKRSKKELVVDSFFEVDAIKGLQKQLKKHTPLFLVLNNDKVLSKHIVSEQQDTKKLVYKAFPNINLNDFYYEILSQEQQHFISLCRKEYVEKIIEVYHILNLHITNISLGHHLVGTISQFLNKEFVFSSNSKITLEKHRITQIEKSETTNEIYHINGLRIKNKQLLSFSGALQLLLNTNSIQTNLSDQRDTLKDSYHQTRFFNLFLRTSGLFILGLLLVNFFFFNHYFNEVSELRQLSQVNQSTKTHILSLDKVVSKKQKLVEDLLKNNGSKSSFYVNEIVHRYLNLFY
ncbi:MAG: hypothetical protein HRU50_15850, partial [Winogradskyella sp.]|uniref:hypothetical protein n=1 Tax=Winogradskyella sp. TaxID=1883156 RepID=UPI0025E6D01E